MQSAQKIKEENGGGTIVTVNDGEEGSLEADEMEALEAFLPMAKKQQVGAKGRANRIEGKQDRGQMQHYRVAHPYHCEYGLGSF